MIELTLIYFAMRFPQSGQAPIYTQQDLDNLLLAAEQTLVHEPTSKLVYPSGSGRSGIFMFGENPGPNDAANNLQFSGPFSQLFNDTLLPLAGLERDDIYLSNLIKCNLPDNRNPLPNEIQEWSPILLAEIIVQKPDLIVCLGRIAAEFFLPEVKITKQHGEFYTVRLFDDLDVNIFLTLHPASPYHNDSLLDDVKRDFLKLGDYVKDPGQIGFNAYQFKFSKANQIADIESLF